MTTIYQYIKRMENNDFTTLPLNEVDVLILNELVYFPLDEYINSDLNHQSGIKLNDLYFLLENTLKEMKKENWVLVSEARIRLLKAISQAKRYQEVIIFGFVNQIKVEEELQFAAMCLGLPTNELLVSYRGTDDTLTGWKEDCNLIYNRLVPAQRLAKNYLTDVYHAFQGVSLTISGHSKGGNLAIYAAAFQDEETQNSINVIYSFDSPGFQLETIETVSYQNIQPKISHYVPEDSIVGMTLFHSQAPIVVKSRKKGFSQHIATNWQIADKQLERLDDRSDFSYLIDAAVKEWTIDRNDEELKKIFNSCFDLLYETGAESLIEITSNPIKFSRLFLERLNLLELADREFLEHNLTNLGDVIKSHLVEQKRDRYHMMAFQFNDWLSNFQLSEHLTFESTLLNKFKERFIQKKEG